MTSQDDVTVKEAVIGEEGMPTAAMIVTNRYCIYFPCAFSCKALRSAKKNQHIWKEDNEKIVSVLFFLAKRAEMSFFLPFYRRLLG